MNHHIENKLRDAERKTGLQFPTELFRFIAGLNDPEVAFAEEEWLFWTVIDDPADPDKNFVISCSINFEQEWKMKGLVFATNGIGDYLVLLPDETGALQEKIFVILHETAEIKVFGQSLEELKEAGPEGYFWSDEYYLKLDEDNNVIRWEDRSDAEERDDTTDDDDDDFFGSDYQLRSRLDDLIDDQRTDQASEIVTGLEKLITSNDKSHQTWALDKLSDVYLRGFGPVPQNLEKALYYNQQAIQMDSHKAYSNRAACYFAGIGMQRNLNKSLEYARKANELSKKNKFADIFASKEGGGMYDGLVDMIEKEIRKQN